MKRVTRGTGDIDIIKYRVLNTHAGISIYMTTGGTAIYLDSFHKLEYSVGTE